jgi:tetratricopeptide (TPR) repeat protein
MTELDGALQVLETPGTDVVVHAIGVLDALQDPWRCEHVDDAEAGAEPPSTTDPRLRTVWRGLGRVDALLRSERFDDAATEAQQTLELAESTGDESTRLRALLAVADVDATAGRFDDAQPRLEGVSNAARAGGHDALAAEASIALVRLAANTGDLDAGDRWADEADALVRRLNGPVHLEVPLLGAKAQLAHHHDDYEAAYRYTKQVAALRADHPSPLRRATAIADLADAALFAGHSKESAAATERALDLFRAGLGSEHPKAGHAMVQAALGATLLGNYAEGIPMMLEAVDLLERAYEPDNPFVLDAKRLLAGMLEAWQIDDEVDALRREVFTSSERVLGWDHPLTAFAALEYAVVLIDEGRSDEAMPLIRKAWSRLEQTYGAGSSWMAIVEGVMGYVHIANGDFDAGREQLQRVLDRTEPDVVPERANYLAGSYELADLERKAGRCETSLHILEPALQIAREEPDLLHSLRAAVLIVAAQCEADLGHPTRAAALASETLDVLAAMGTASPDPAVLTAIIVAAHARDV